MSKLLKISREKAEEFGLPTAEKFLGFEIANYYLEKIDNGRTKGVMYYVKVKIPIYLVLCIPLHAIHFWSAYGMAESDISASAITKSQGIISTIVIRTMTTL